MRAAVIRKYGPPSIFTTESLPEPQPGPNEVKIKVMASSVNPVDWKVRSGSLAVLAGWQFPRVLGADFSGEVVACGAQVTNYAPGAAVFGFTSAIWGPGAYAEYVCCPTAKLAHKPSLLDHTRAATVPLAGSTAYQALYQHGNLKPGMHVLVTGATGGVGHFAVQIAKAAGCTVYGVCHSSNAQLARQLGCDEVLPYDQTDFRQSSTRFALIFDAAAKYGYFSCRRVLAKNGSYVGTLPMPFLLLAHGLSFLPGKKGRFVGVASRTAQLNFLAGLCNSGKLMPLVEHQFPLTALADAHALSETEKVRGKIAIRISQ